LEKQESETDQKIRKELEKVKEWVRLNKEREKQEKLIENQNDKNESNSWLNKDKERDLSKQYHLNKNENEFNTKDRDKSLQKPPIFPTSTKNKTNTSTEIRQKATSPKEMKDSLSTLKSSISERTSSTQANTF